MSLARRRAMEAAARTAVAWVACTVRPTQWQAQPSHHCPVTHSLPFLTTITRIGLRRRLTHAAYTVALETMLHCLAHRTITVATRGTPRLSQCLPWGHPLGLCRHMNLCGIMALSQVRLNFPPLNGPLSIYPLTHSLSLLLLLYHSSPVLGMD